MDTLEKCNLTVENAKAINQYSNDSNMILSIKKGLVDKAQVKEKISAEMISKLQSRGISEEQITSIESYIEGLDFNKPVHENYEEVNRYLNEINISSNCYSSVCTAIKSKNSLSHIESTLVNLDEGLSKARLPQSMKLYRAIKTNGDINAKDYIEKNMSNDGYTSTSPLYETSFAKYDDYDTVIEIYAPKGTQGLYMSQLSDYDDVEQEVLLNTNDIYIIDAKDGIVDKNGRTKTMLQGLLLSKEKECYKGIDVETEEHKILNTEEKLKTQVEKENLPIKYNRFSNFFNKVRSKFTRKSKIQYNNSVSIEKEESKHIENNFELELKENVMSLDEIVENSQDYSMQDEEILQENIESNEYDYFNL